METDVLMNGSVSDWPSEDNLTTMTPMSFYSTSSLTALHYLRAALYWMMFVVGVPGNVLVVAVVIWKLAKSTQHQTMTIFVGSLAMSDIGMLLSVTWASGVLSINEHQWLFGKFLCQMHAMWRSLTADCSVATLMIISVDRLA